MSCAMSSLQSVILQGVVYVGGGVTLSDDHYARTIYKYHPQEDEWVELNEYKYVWFTMAILNNKLIVVGGYDPPPQITTNEIAVWETNKWMCSYPHMSTCRHSTAVATYKHWLVVAGGVDSDHNDLDTVEVLDTESQHCQWLSTTPLPMICRHMKSVIVHDKLFLIGGTLAKQALFIPLKNITKQSGATSTPTEEWCTLQETPLAYSAAIAFNGSLLTVGGRLDNVYSTAIHIYQSETEQWKKVGELPTPRSSCSCALLPNGEILVVGGKKSPAERTDRVDAVTLKI